MVDPLSFLGGIGASSVLQPLISPFTRSMEHGMNDLLPTEILQTNEIVDLYHRGGLTKDGFYKMMRRHGYNDIQARSYYYTSDNLPSPEQITVMRIADQLEVELKHLQADAGTPDTRAAQILNIQKEYRARMKQLGYRGKVADAMFKANRPVPSNSTILSWMAKEVFEPTFITKFTFDQEQPELLAPIMASYGVPATEAKNYWIEHWREIGREFWNELYARFSANRNEGGYSDIDLAELTALGLTWNDVKISEQDYKDYYAVLELPKYFRDRGLAALYRPIPFSTLQQLWQYGVLTYTQMVGRLRDVGFSKISAEYILDAWQRKFPYGAKEPLRDNVTRKYSLRKITRTAAETALTTAGVEADAISFLLDSIDDNIEEKNIQYKLKSMKYLLRSEKFTLAEIKTELTRHFPSMTTERINYEADKLFAENLEYVKATSVRIVGKAYESSTMTTAEFKTWMTDHHIPSGDQDIIVNAYGGVKS